LALEQAAGLGLAAVACLSPVVSGRRYVRQLTMIGIADPSGSGDVAFGGALFGSGLLAALDSVDVADAAGHCPVPLLLVSRPGVRLPAVARRSRVVDEWRPREFMERPAEEAEVDADFVERLAGIPYIIKDRLMAARRAQNRLGEAPKIGGLATAFEATAAFLGGWLGGLDGLCGALALATFVEGAVFVLLLLQVVLPGARPRPPERARSRSRSRPSLPRGRASTSAGRRGRADLARRRSSRRGP